MPVKIAVAGANGYVGRALCSEIEKNGKFEILRVTRENCERMKTGDYDILINAAMPAKRFWAKNHPEDDRRETVEKTREFYRGWKYKKFIQISSVSARCEADTIYGKHKAEAEAICNDGKSLIIRLSAMFNEDLPTGVLIDILKGNKVYVSGRSRYCFAARDFVAGWIVNRLDLEGVVEVGAKNTLSLHEIAEHLKKKVEFEGREELQEAIPSRPEFPDSREVLSFMDQMVKRGIK